MGFCCRDLFELKYFSKSRLLAGEKGLNKEISLPYVRTTESISAWLYGRELLFITYEDNIKSDNNLLLLLEECIEKKISGIVILIDDKHIDSISMEMIDRSNESDLPLFIMPWNIKLIDIIQEIFLKIEQKREESKKGKHFLESLIFSQDECHGIVGLAEFYNIKLRPYHYICILKTNKTSDISQHTEVISKKVISGLEDRLSKESYTLIHTEYANYLICLIFSNNDKEIHKSVEWVEDIFDIISYKYLDKIEMNLSFSRIREIDPDIKTSYKEAVKALSMIGIYNKDSRIMRYDELGIIKLFMELEDLKYIKQYCYENLGPILEYDKNHGMDLIGTLKCYFQNNRHLIKTSQELFIHRNTLLYRLTTIKKLLKRDLDNAMIDLELFNSILIYEFLNLQKEK